MGPSVCLWVNIFKHEYHRNQRAHCNEILSEASLGGGKDALGFGALYLIRTVVSMATDSSHRVIMGKMVFSLFMPPTLKKWGAYWFWLVHASVRSKKIQARVWKFHIWIPRQK